VRLKLQTVEFLTGVSGKLIYGTIITAAVIGALGFPLPGNITVIVTVLFSLLAVCLAHAYTHMISEDMVN